MFFITLSATVNLLRIIRWRRSWENCSLVQVLLPQFGPIIFKVVINMHCGHCMAVCELSGILLHRKSQSMLYRLA